MSPNAEAARLATHALWALWTRSQDRLALESPSSQSPRSNYTFATRSNSPAVRSIARSLDRSHPQRSHVSNSLESPAEAGHAGIVCVLPHAGHASVTQSSK
jgi:hypothetical protein